MHSGNAALALFLTMLETYKVTKPITFNPITPVTCSFFREGTKIKFTFHKRNIQTNICSLKLAISLKANTPTQLNRC